MGHLFFQSARPLVFAHRGGAGLAPENTVAAFDNGLRLGADGLELDVRLSRDGQVVVVHDRDLGRTTPLHGAVEAHGAQDLAYHGIPLLAGILARYAATRIIVEMKVNSVQCARAVVDVVREAGAAERVCLGSFGLRALRTARALAPSIATSAAREEVRYALYRSWCRWPVSRVCYGGYQVPELSGRTRVVSERFVRDAHHAGLAVQVWTVDTVADARRLLSWGIDALITDRPDLIVPVVKELAADR